ncbi:MAG: PKD domain-containing protein [Bacteroidia bacterium]
MRRLITLIAALMCLFGTEVHATHFMGSNMHYDCITPDIIRITLSTYYDCTGAATTAPPGVPSNPFLRFTGQLGTNCTQPTLRGSWTTQHYVDITPVCPGTITGCNTTPFGQMAPINGTMEAIQFANYDFDSVTCNVYGVEWSSCCRNGAITSGADNQGMYLGGLIIDLTTAPCNNSPRFLNPPVAYICAGSPARFENQAYDPDGDSLVYSLTSCKQSNNNGSPFGALSVNYNPGYSPSQPLGPGWVVSLDQTTGDINVIPRPGPAVIGVLCVEVAEYRNGNLLSTTVRDIQFFVTNCTANNNPRINQLTVLSGANQRGFYALDGAVGVPLSFSVQVLDPDVADVLTSDFDTVNTQINGLTYSTSGTNPQIITANWTPPAPGRYVIRLISQDQSCPLPSTSMKAVVIEVEPYSVIGNITNTPCDSTNGAIDITVAGGSAPFQYQWSTGDTTEDLSGISAGTYSVIIVDQNGDSTSRTFLVDGSNINLSAVVVDTSCNAGSSIQLNVSGGTPPYSYQWTTGDTSASLIGLPSNSGYGVLVTDATGCPKAGAWWVNGPDSCFNVVQGCVYNDLNGNCVQDSGEAPLANVQVGLLQAGITVLTDSNGHYSIATTNVGLDSIYVQNTPYLQASCPATGMDTIQFDSLGMVIDYKFGMVADTTKDLVAIRCPSWARPGRTMCVSMFARNDGGKIMNGTLRWRYDSIFTYNSSNPTHSNHDSVNRVLEWDFMNLQPGQRFHVSVCMTVDSTVGAGFPYTDTLWVDPIACDSVPGNNVMVYSDTTTNSYDPNDKQASPAQRMDEGWLMPNEEMLTYTVRFQNTGSDTAFYVIVEDDIDVNTLDISTLHLVGASHPYKTRILNNQKLEVRFDNINLPALIQDEAGSQGFYTFTINRKAGLPYRTAIRNSAAIFFDFNDPIITNSVLRTVYDDMISQGPEFPATCTNGVTTISVTQGAAPYTFYWPSGYVDMNNPTGVSNGQVAGAGSYQVRVVDAVGEEIMVNFSLTQAPDPNANFFSSFQLGTSSVRLEGEPNQLAWNWDLGDGNTASGMIVNHTYATSAIYEVTLITSNDCGRDTLTRWIDMTVGIEDDDFAKSVTISPNPMANIAEIRFENPQQQVYSLELYDLRGRAVRSYPTTQGNSFVVEKGELQAGVYLFKLNGPYRYYGRLVIQ